MYRLVRRFLLVLVMLITMPGYAAAQTVVVSFGDSITKGWPYQPHELNGSRGGPFPLELERLLRLQNPGSDIVVRNYGIGGENTFESVSRLNGVLANTRPNWVTIMIGTNDLWTGISPNSTAANIGFMVDRVRAWGARAAVSNLLPSTYPGHPGHLIPTHYNPAIEQVIAARGVAFNDVYSIFSPHWATTTRDGIHPNYAGYLLLGQTFCSVISICSTNRLRTLGSSGQTEGLAPAPWLDILLGD